MVDDIFKNEDEDKDGFISTREFVYQHDELWTIDFKMCVMFVALKSTVFMHFINVVFHICETWKDLLYFWRSMTYLF